MEKNKKILELSITLLAIQIPIQCYFEKIVLLIGIGFMLITLMIYYCCKYVIKNGLMQSIQEATISIDKVNDINR